MVLCSEVLLHSPQLAQNMQCLGYLNMQERDRQTSATALADFHAPSLKLTYIALLAFERMLQETSTCRNAGQTCCK